ncbi:MAG: hypothetical protein AAGD33_23220 [Actinomycetota bacterium]
MARVHTSSSAYSHRQASLWPNLILVVPSVIGLVVTLTLTATGDLSAGAVVPFVVLLVVGLIRATFITLETEVSGGELRLRFRPLGPTKVIQLDAITSHEVVRLPWYAGYGGLEWLTPRRAWLWSSSGRSALEVRHRTHRGRVTRTYIGTDDAAGLDAAITVATSRRPTHA